MSFIDKLSRLLLAPPPTGIRALSYMILLVAIPTAIRLLLGLVTDRMPFFPYIPFVIVAASILNWRHAGAVALASWIVGDLLFIGPPYRLGFGVNEVIAFTIFLVSAALIVTVVEAVRLIVENSLRPTRPGEFSTPVIFSLEGGQAWASWHGSHSWVRLGPEDDVAEMMQDFLAQRELAKRLQSSAATAAKPTA